MEKQTKLLLGIGAIAVALYLILRPKGVKAQTQMPMQSTPTQTNFDCPTDAIYCKYVIPSGIVFEGKLVGRSVSIYDTPKNQYDNGGRALREGEFKILQVIKDGVKDAPYMQKQSIDGFELYNGAILSVMTTKDVVSDYQNNISPIAIAQGLVDEYNKMAEKQVSEGRSQFNEQEMLRAAEINKELHSLGYAMSSKVPSTLITLDEYNKLHEGDFLLV